MLQGTYIVPNLQKIFFVIFAVTFKFVIFLNQKPCDGSLVHVCYRDLTVFNRLRPKTKKHIYASTRLTCFVITRNHKANSHPGKFWKNALLITTLAFFVRDTSFHINFLILYLLTKGSIIKNKTVANSNTTNQKKNGSKKKNKKRKKKKATLKNLVQK